MQKGNWEKKGEKEKNKKRKKKNQWIKKWRKEGKEKRKGENNEQRINKGTGKK